MTIEIPVWLLWTLGVVIGVPLLLFIIVVFAFGLMFLSCWKMPSW